jgi:RHH-type proline utilization regulon transcriptional repressor/proline dehydrogenase/delta 1-pyrroline-5-carboxylate dehydrogenase
VGNIYVNRNIVGAVVGVQPFGGEGKSGTGPKAGGPLYLKRLQRAAAPVEAHARQATAGTDAFVVWARGKGHEPAAGLAEQYLRTTPFGMDILLPGPTGERNTLRYAERGVIACCAQTTGALLNQLAAVLATGNRAVVVPHGTTVVPADLPAAVMDRIQVVTSLDALKEGFQIALVESALSPEVRVPLAARDGAIVSVIDTTPEAPVPLWRLIAERALCVNTTAAGGNASLMTLGA